MSTHLLSRRVEVMVATAILVLTGLTIASHVKASSNPSDVQPAGLAGPVSSLADSPSISGPTPPEIVRWLNLNARMLNSAAAPVDTVRLLRSGLGREGRSVYAYRSNGVVCFLLTGEGGTCGNPGFIWTLGGGDGVTDDGALVGVATDNVNDVRLVVDGNEVPVSLKDNVAYADLPLGGSNATITVTYADGQTTRDSLALKGTS